MIMGTMNTIPTKITVYGCEKEEAHLFREISPRFRVLPTITKAPVSVDNAALARGNRCISVSHKARIASSTLFALKDMGVEYISTRSIGHNHIDVETAEKLGITVGNVVYSPGSVADYTVMLLLLAIRNAKSVVSRAQSHDFRLEAARGRELRDLTVGVLGTGRIGRAVIRRLFGFGCRILAYDPDPDLSLRVSYVSLETLLEESDIVTLHLPLTEKTYHFLDEERIAQMKAGAFLINTGRGALVDSDALITALTRDELGGAALDVLEGEEGLFYFDYRQKPIDHRLLLQLEEMPQVIITPHTAYHTQRALYDTVEKTVLNCLDFERSETLCNK